MAKRTASEIYSALVAAGYTPAAASVQTAIALAESAGDDASLGDLTLQTNTWGPSYGVFQIRTVKGETGSGSVRDINWLAGSLQNQARAAYQISRGGTDFTPWSVYTSGKYQSFLGQAAAASGALIGAIPGVLSGALSGAASQATGLALAGARSIVLEGLFVMLGLGLVAAGLARAFHPVRRATDELRREADQATEVVGALV